jgi:CubicO group peptidase (beta-lactamase class C family)
MKNLYALFFLILSAAVYPQYNFRIADSVLTSFNKPGSPGVTVLVRKDGQLLYNKSVGYADIMKGKLITNKTLFNIASDTKKFTAACIILLEQKGKLKLEDKLSKYFPDFPEYANKITIQDLLNHTAGLKDYKTLLWMAGKEIEDCSNDDIRKILKMNTLNFEPGSEWSYSNSGYWCMVQIIEQVSGMPIESFAEKNIFKPLNMKDSRYVRDASGVQNAAVGYTLKDGAYVACPADNGPFGGSGMLATANDMLKWFEEMDTKKVLGTAFWNATLSGTKYEYDKNCFYSNGLFFDTYAKKERISHGGDLDGFHSEMCYFPSEKLDIVIITNRGDFKVSDIYRAITSQFFGSAFKWPAPAPEPITLSKDILGKYTGLYELEGMVFEISVKNNTISARQLWDNRSNTAVPVGEALFTVQEEEANLSFENIVKGKAQVLNITQGGEVILFKKIEKYDMPHYSSYTGRFSCKSLGAEYSFLINEGKLFCAIGKNEPLPVGAIEEDTIMMPQGQVTFHRKENGALAGFTLNHPRVKNLEFVKI